MKSIEEQIAECDKKIEMYTEKKKKLLEKQKNVVKLEEEKQMKDLAKFIKGLGLNNSSDIQKIKNDLETLYKQDEDKKDNK